MQQTPVSQTLRTSTSVTKREHDGAEIWVARVNVFFPSNPQIMWWAEGPTEEAAVKAMQKKLTEMSKNAQA